MSIFAVADSPSVLATAPSKPVIFALVIGVIVAVYVGGTIVARRRGYSGIGGNTVVRCRKGHIFTTLWVPGVSIKSIRLGAARVQHCPVGHHWSLVIPVKDSDLTEEDKVSAETHHDLRIP
jgi:hypothetical protein